MGNCTNTKNISSSTLKKTDKQMKAIKMVKDEIERLKEQELFNQALMKMSKLASLLKIHRQENTYYQEVMELYVEMGRINQDIVGNHVKACQCFENAIEMSIYAYGQNNEIATKIITPFLTTSLKAVEETHGSVKQMLQQKPQPTQQDSKDNGRKQFKRSSTHATTRVTVIPPSLNIIMEESSEHEEEHAKHWDEQVIVNSIFNNKNKETLATV